MECELACCGRRGLVLAGTLLVAATAWLAWCDPRTACLLANTLEVAAATCLLSVPVSLALALVLLRTDLPGRRVALLIIGAMLFVPLYVQMAGWHGVFQLLSWPAASGTALARPLVDGFAAAVWIHAAAAVPWATLIIGVGLLLVEPELEQEGLLVGSAPLVLWRVTLVRAVPSVLAASLWVTVATAGEITVTDIFRVRTWAEEIYASLGATLRQGWLSVATGAVVVGWLTAAGVLLARWLAPPASFGSLAGRWRFRLSGWRWPITAATWSLLVLLVVVPFVQLLHDGGMATTLVGERAERSWSCSKLAWILCSTPGRFAEEMRWTACIGVLAAAATLLAASALAWPARRGGVAAVPALLAVACGLGIPGPMVGVVVEWLLNRGSWPWMVWLYDRTVLAPVLATMVRQVPVVTMVLWYSFRAVGSEQLDSAATEGAGPLARFWHIGLRQQLAALAAAGLVALAVAWGELSASIMVLPPGVDTVQRTVFGLVHYAYYDRVAGLCLLSSGVFVALGAIVLALVRLQQQRIRPQMGEPPRADSIEKRR